MKTIPILSLGLIVAGLALSAGCSKPEEQSAAPAASQPAAEVTKAADTTTVDAQKIDPQVQANVDDLRKQTEKAATAAKDQAAAAADQAAATANKAAADASAALNTQTQASFDNVKKLLEEKKWSEALQALNTLAAEKLTPEQQATLASLKQEAQKLIQQAAATSTANEGAKALNDLLPKK